MTLQVLFISILLFSFTKHCNPGDQSLESRPDNASIKNLTADTLNNAVRFGVMVAKTEGTLIPPAQQVQVAKALGVKYIRARIDIQGWSGSNAAYDTYAAAGLKVLLNIIDGILKVIDTEEVAGSEIFNIGTEVQHTTAYGIETVEKLTGKKNKIYHAATACR